MSFTNTGVMCTVYVPDPNREEGFKMVDLGNYFRNYKDGKRCLITSRENADKYGHMVDAAVYVLKGRA